MDLVQEKLNASVAVQSTSPTASDMSHEERDFSSGDTLNELNAGGDQPYHDSEPSTPPGDRSTAFLDGLRGYAALCVFIQHYIPGFDLQVHEHGFGQLDPDGTKRHYYIAGLPFLRSLFNGGNAAVAVFFVLSGYVLTRAPLRLLRDGQWRTCRTSLASAVVRRPIRLYLPVFIVTFLVAMAAHVPGPLMEQAPWSQPKKTLWIETRHWWKMTTRFFNPFQTHDSDHTPYYYTAVAWTLPIELKGSMFAYALVVLFAVGGAKPGRGTIYYFILANIILHIGRWSWACFTFGVLLAIMDVNSTDLQVLKQYYTARGRHWWYQFCFWFGWYLLSEPAVGSKPIYSTNTPGWQTLTLMIPRTYNEHHYYRYWQTYGAFLVVYACLRLEWVQKILRSKALMYLGKVSFMLYLVHLPFFRVWGDRVSRAVVARMPNGWEEPEHHGWYDRLIPVPEIGPDAMNTRFILAMALNLPVTLLVAHAATKWIDMPCVRLGKRVAQRLGLDSSSNGQLEQAGVALPQWTRPRAHSS